MLQNFIWILNRTTDTHIVANNCNFIREIFLIVESTIYIIQFNNINEIRNYGSDIPQAQIRSY